MSAPDIVALSDISVAALHAALLVPDTADFNEETEPIHFEGTM